MQNIKSILNNNREITGVIILFLLVFLILLITGINGNYIKEGKLYISEIMAKNTYTIKDNNEEYSDYIEIYNGYNEDINLLGYHLSDSEYETNRWTFPEIIIKSKEYLLIYASGKNKCEEKDNCHTNFKLSSKGEAITLSDSSGNIINKFTYPSLSNDLAYGYVKNKYMILDSPSPGKENGVGLKYQNIDNDLSINEYMSSNKSINYNTSGKYNDFVELYNSSNEDIKIHNIYLSDDLDNLTKYKLPDVTIKKKDYLLVYLTDESKVIDNEIYANFKLSKEDKYLVMTNGKNIIDKVELVELLDNVSYGKLDGKWYYFTKSTPGYENSTIPLDRIDNGKGK